MNITPHLALTIWSPDTVAECMPCSDELYRFLWNALVPLYDKQPRSECNDDFNTRCVAKFWSHIPAHLQLELNAIAEKGDN
jgi:hypothetical protein